jgi:leucyl-tRNA synthetase
LNKVWSLADKISEEKSAKDDQVIVNQTIKKVTHDFSKFHFNTAISALMELTNHFVKQEKISSQNFEILIQLLSPLAPYTTEELWEKLGHKESIFNSVWPKFDQNLIAQQKVFIVIQVNGKYRGEVEVQTGLKQTDIELLAKKQQNVAKYLKGNPIKKVVFVPDRLINFVI